MKKVYTLEYKGEVVEIWAEFDNKGDYAYDSLWSELTGNMIPAITFYTLEYDEVTGERKIKEYLGKVSERTYTRRKWLFFKERVPLEESFYFELVEVINKCKKVIDAIHYEQERKEYNKKITDGLPDSLNKNWKG